MSSIFLFKVAQAAFCTSKPSNGLPSTFYIKSHKSPATEGDIAILCTTGKSGHSLTPKACFVISSNSEEDPVCYSVVIEKFDPSKKASHLIRYHSVDSLVEVS